jgi:hypothetical protein
LWWIRPKKLCYSHIFRSGTIRATGTSSAIELFSKQLFISSISWRFLFIHRGGRVCLEFSKTIYLLYIFNFNSLPYWYPNICGNTNIYFGSAAGLRSEDPFEIRCTVGCISREPWGQIRSPWLGHKVDSSIEMPIINVLESTLEWT